MPDSRRPRLWALFGAAALPFFACLVGLFAPWLAPYSPTDQFDPVAAKYRPPGTVLQVIERVDNEPKLADRVTRSGDVLRITVRGKVSEIATDGVSNLTADGVADHHRFLLGTDRLGRDLLSRLIYGARTSMTITLLAIVVLTALGVTVGAVAAMSPGWLDAILMRLVDAMLTFPWLFVVILLTAFVEQPSLAMIAFVLGATGWMPLTRLLRAEIISLKEREFVLAAEGLGLHPFRVFWRHLLPNALSPVLVQIFLLCGRLILLESGLSFLGFGVEVPQASWGNLIADSQIGLTARWWLIFWPGLAISLTVIGFNFFGDRLRDLLDPRVQTS